MFPSLKIDLANTADLMKCRLLRFFIWVFTVCQIANISTCLGVLVLKGLKIHFLTFQIQNHVPITGFPQALEIMVNLENH